MNDHGAKATICPSGQLPDRRLRPTLMARSEKHRMHLLGAVQRAATQTSPRALLHQMRFDAPPILIGGCGRSGTTMLLAMLGAHPQIAAIPTETTLFARRRKHRYPRLNHYLMRARAALVLSREPVKPDAHRWCEKTPPNIRFVERLFAHFGDVRFIHIVRDARDVVTSRHPHAEGPYVPVERWVADVSAGLAHRHDPRMYTLRYEDLVEDYEPTMRALLAWLEEPFTDEMASYHAHTSVKRNTALRGGKARPVSTSSVGRWRDPKFADDVATVMASPEAVAILKDLGYLSGSDNDAGGEGARPA